MEQSVDDMSIKELKALVSKAGLSFADCAEKSELRDRAREAAARLAGTTTRPTSSTPATASIAGWETRFEYMNGGGERDVELGIVLMHGIGASADDLVPLASALAPGLGVKCLFVFPAAPDRSWWPLDPAQWMMQAVAGDASLARMIRTEFPGLADCRDKGAKLVADVRRRAGPHAKIVLGGFSQGAMTSTDIALALEEPVDALVHLSGAPIVVDRWAKALETNKPCVYLAHGRSDFVLPFVASSWTKALFEKANVQLTYAPHDGQLFAFPNRLARRPRRRSPARPARASRRLPPRPTPGEVTNVLPRRLPLEVLTSANAGGPLLRYSS